VPSIVLIVVVTSRPTEKPLSGIFYAPKMKAARLALGRLLVRDRII